MSSAGDQYTYQKSLQTQRERTPFSKKSTIYAVDTNTGSYQSGQINFDLSQFANVTNGFLNFAEASLQIPIVITATAPDAVAGPACLDHWLGIRNGTFNFINNMTVEIDGKPCVQTNNFTNAWVSYKLLSSMTHDELVNFGPTLCFTGPDESDTWVYNNWDTASVGGNPNNSSKLVNGTGLCNNSIYRKTYRYPPRNTARNNGQSDDKANTGLYERMCLINDRPDNKITEAIPIGNTVSQNLGSIRDQTSYQNELKNFTAVTSPGAQGFVQQWFILATIPLKYLSDIWENIPLVRGLYVKMQIQCNVGSCVINVPNDKTATSPAMYMKPSECFFQYTNPICVAERATNGNVLTLSGNAESVSTEGAQPTTGEVVANIAGQKFLISVGITQAPSTSVPTFSSHSGKGTKHEMSSARITIPVVEMKPNDIVPYLEATKEHRVEWYDFYQTQFSCLGGSNFNSLISNGARDIVGLLIVPQISGASNGRVNNAAGADAGELANSGFNTLLSPFWTENVAPISISNLQVLVGNENIISPFLTYNYEAFLYHFNEFLRINGNKSSLCSGLISQKSWENLYRYYFINLNRKLDDDVTPKSITIMGKNNSTKDLACDFLVYVIQRKSMLINTSTGRVSAVL